MNNTHAEPSLYLSGEHIISSNPFMATHITFACHNGSIEISLKDGTVKLIDCCVDDAAKAFWNAVALHAPMRKAE